MSQFSNRFDSTDHNTQPYVAALLDLVGDRDPLLLLPSLLPRIEALTDDLYEGQLHAPEAPGKWSISNVVQHLADAELVMAVRYRMIVAHDTPAIAGYDQDAFATRLHYDQVSLEESLELLGVLRRGNLRLLERLSPEERQRAGMHAERGRETVERLMKLNAAHDIVHLRQIERIRSGARPPGKS